MKNIHFDMQSEVMFTFKAEETSIFLFFTFWS